MIMVRRVAGVLLALAACAPEPGDDATPSAAAQTGAAPRSSSASEWLGDDPAAFADGLIRQIRSFERPVDDDEKALGTTWDAELARARARFVAAKTSDDVYYAFLS